MKEKLSSILQELESDDELPDTYNDVSILPAYQNDNRFDEIKFPWVNVNIKYEDIKSDSSEILCQKGVLKGQDLYCLQSVGSSTCSSTFIWFINFLLQKDLHSHYNYLKSCLVNDFISTVPFTKRNYSLSEETPDTDRFEIVIKL